MVLNNVSSAPGRYGLLGRKLGHSYSPLIHGMLADYDYELHEIEPDCVERFIRGGDYAGLNVTIPYKQVAYGCCDELSPAAQKLGNVNTLHRKQDGTLYGDNTDYFGLSYLLDSAGMDVSGAKVLVLGTGGASKTAQAVLIDKGAREVVAVSRTGKNNYQNLDLHTDTDFIVNATPVGMFPNCPASPLSLSCFIEGVGSVCEQTRARKGGLRGVVDLVYNPERTGLMLQAEKLGIPHASGLSMLVAQAKASCELWQGTAIDNARIDEIASFIASSQRNIVLIGMPSCGKSTVGKLLATALGRNFVDLDEEIVKLAGISIPEIFEQSGEAGFRDFESKVCVDFGKLSGCVISCGGGVVERQENYDLLHQNGAIVYIQRNLADLVSVGRPVSMARGIEELAKSRRPRYEAWADVAVTNDCNPGSTVRAICQSLGLLYL